MTETKMTAWNMGNPEYTLSTRIKGGNFDDVMAKTRVALKGEGFGVLTEINFTATMKAKMDVDLPRYQILGACNPPLAHKALLTEPGIGALLPCNVVIAEEADGIFVGAIHPTAMFSVVDRPDVAPLAVEVAEKLTRVLAAVSASD
jgi:uncharacterized protein (DUF302 family)